MKTRVLVELFVGIAVSCAAADAAHRSEIANGSIRAHLNLPDAQTGFYRGTRFDWAGVIEGLDYKGHTFYPKWYDRTDTSVHDFVYDGTNIIAGPCTAITGPAEEFVSNGKALGFDEAKPGGTFIKIGVGVLRRPDDRKYDPYRVYPIADGGRWTVTQRQNVIEFQQELEDRTTGYGYQYRKIVSLVGDKPVMVLDHILRNTGKRAIETSVYNHNFMFLDRQAPGPDCSVTVPFVVHAAESPATRLARVRSNHIAFAKRFDGEDRVYLDIRGFGSEAKDYDIRVENRSAGAGVRITCDRPLSRLALWAIRAPLSIEPFIDMKIEPGAEFNWRINYEYYVPQY